tara:strand:- start:510 stop:851 length:342 start_codon:yes stop_codon:yes gene_type:complete
MSLGENPTLNEVVEKNTQLKELVVNYVGNAHNPESGEVTVEMIVETMAKEFPEFLMVIAEENWIRGYHQALNDVEHGEKLAKEGQTTATEQGSAHAQLSALAENKQSSTTATE